ncbi:MAG: hypothetical protein ACTHQQ_10605 [Solirubrobacteraceae bacterium]
MCILCYGLTGEEHWSDAHVGRESTASVRARRRALLTAIMAAHGLGYSDDPTGVTSLISDRKGKVQVARSLAEVWAAGEQLVKRPLDPLEPALLAQLNRGAPGT